MLALAGAADGCGRTADAPAGDDVVQAIPGDARRAWIADNAQAEAVGGALSVSINAEGETAFAFAQGITVRAVIAPDYDAAALADENGRLVELLGAPAGSMPLFYEVRTETVAMSAPEGGLCGGLRTTLLAVVEFVDAENAWALRLASFHRANAAEGGHGAPVHCFSYDYKLPAY